MRDCVGQPAGPSNPGAVASNMCSRDLVAAQTNERHVCSGLPSNVGVKSGPDARSTTVFRFLLFFFNRTDVAVSRAALAEPLAEDDTFTISFMRVK